MDITSSAKFPFILTSFFNKGSFFLWEEPTRCGGGVKHSRFLSSSGFGRHENCQEVCFCFVFLTYRHYILYEKVSNTIQDYSVLGCASFTQTEFTTIARHSCYICQGCTILYVSIKQAAPDLMHLSMLILQGGWMLARGVLDA